MQMHSGYVRLKPDQSLTFAGCVDSTITFWGRFSLLPLLSLPISYFELAPLIVVVSTFTARVSSHLSILCRTKHLPEASMSNINGWPDIHPQN